MFKKFSFSQANGRGWDGGCIDIPDLREGNIKVSSYRELYMGVEKR